MTRFRIWLCVQVITLGFRLAGLSQEERIELLTVFLSWRLDKTMRSDDPVVH